MANADSQIPSASFSIANSTLPGKEPWHLGRIVCLPSPSGGPTSLPLSCLSSNPLSPTPLQRALSAMLANGSLTLGSTRRRGLALPGRARLSLFLTRTPRKTGPGGGNVPPPALSTTASPFLAVPTSPELSLEPPLFRVLLLRRLRLPLPFGSASCSCGSALDELGDHRSACPRSGALRSRAGPLERATARVCCEPAPRSPPTPSFET